MHVIHIHLSDNTFFRLHVILHPFLISNHRYAKRRYKKPCSTATTSSSIIQSNEIPKL